MGYDYGSEPDRGFNQGVKLYQARIPIPAGILKAFREERSRPLLPVKVLFSPRIRAQGSNITGTITKVEIIWKSGVVTQVPAGDKFDVLVKYQALNPAGGNWAVAGTGIQTDGQQPHCDVDNVYLKTSVTGQFYIQDGTGQNNFWTMPNAAITLRITLWAYPITSNVPEFRAAIPQSQW